MSESVVSKRYADALFSLGQEKLILEKLVEEFTIVRNVFQSNEQVKPFLMHPGVKIVNKKQMITEAFKGMSPEVLNTLNLLIDRRRIDIVEDMIEQLIQLFNESKGIADATVYSVRALTDDEKVKVKESLAKRLGKDQIRIENVTDPSLLGGLRIRVGNTIFDGSISGKLKRIERNIVTRNV